MKNKVVSAEEHLSYIQKMLDEKIRVSILNSKNFKGKFLYSKIHMISKNHYTRKDSSSKNIELKKTFTELRDENLLSKEDVHYWLNRLQVLGGFRIFSHGPGATASIKIYKPSQFDKRYLEIEESEGEESDA